MQKIIIILMALIVFAHVQENNIDNIDDIDVEEDIKQQVLFLIKEVKKKDKQYKEVLQKLKQHERKIQNYEQYIDGLKKEIESISERIDEVEEDDQYQELREEMEDIIEETEGEVVDERMLGLLQNFFGNHFLNLSGYYNFEYLIDSKEDSANTFRAHRLTFYFQKRIHQFNFFAELEFTDAPSLGNDDYQGEIALEQSWVEYLYNPLLNIRGGLILIPEYYNLHHAPTFTNSTLDPLHVGNIFPESFVGISVYGDSLYMLSENWGMSYTAYIGNGPSQNEGFSDDNENKIIGSKVTIHLPKFHNISLFDISSNFYYGRDDNKNIDNIWNVELLMQLKDLYLTMEYAQGRKSFSDPNQNLQKSYGGYVELAYSFIGDYVAFSRAEIFDADRRNKKLLKRLYFGLRYKPWSEITIKGEVFHEWNSDNSEEEFYGAAFSFVVLL